MERPIKMPIKGLLKMANCVYVPEGTYVELLKDGTKTIVKIVFSYFFGRFISNLGTEIVKNYINFVFFGCS
jgi:hypothetical protein